MKPADQDLHCFQKKIKKKSLALRLNLVSNFTQQKYCDVNKFVNNLFSFFTKQLVYSGSVGRALDWGSKGC